ncbi:hypothetical protein KBK19_04990 [Microvirga sp. STR05]|uniref:Dienelactone hydrolase domain-containing protein n=1 Tax=Hymenobacter duratus TaxID=2771356 RepID=A0ABR8JIM2_9BACT|nr:hypothetical protein [Hymenobacter duratus]MBD2714384.1 hypothetical protein [Hymenobacter duratus]MBR7949287.1 hypothetical protein [Microvirga sp. STR05]
MILARSALFSLRTQPRAWQLLLPVLAGGLWGCLPDSGQKAAVALPTGHYEGTVAYQGTELVATLDLREVSPGQLEADVRFPQNEGLSFPAANLSYTEPQLLLNSPAGGSSISAIREGDFLRGVFALDSIKADFVWVRRGKALPRAYQTKQQPAARGLPSLTLLIPQDTLASHPAVALFAGPAAEPAARLRAAQLAGQGIVATVVVLPPAPQPADSALLQSAVQVLQALRREPAVDTLRIGMWAHGTATVVPAAVLARPKAAFVVLENVPVSSMEDARPFQLLSRQKIPVLGLYAAADTSLNAKDSARRLRNAARGQHGTQVRLFPGADARFLLPGQSNADGKWTWPSAAPGYLPAIADWLK